MLANLGISNRINCLIESMIRHEPVYWEINGHCSLPIDLIFDKGIYDIVSFSNKPVGNKVWNVDQNQDALKVLSCAEIIYNLFLPNYIPEIYNKSIHARWFGYEHQISKYDFLIQCRRFAEGDNVFILSDTNRDMFEKIKNKAEPLSKELCSDQSRYDLNDQFNFCKDLKTIWASKECLTNSWKTTITDMRVFLKKNTLVAIGDNFDQYKENFVSHSPFKGPNLF